MELPSGCGVCGKQDGLLRCSGCKAMMYCGVEHQIAHRKEHWSACSAIRKSRFAIEKEEQALRGQPCYICRIAEIFCTPSETRSYMAFHCDLCNAMDRCVNRFESLIAEVDRLMEETGFHRAPVDVSRDGDLTSSRAREMPLPV